MPSNEERNAAFDGVKDEVITLIKQLAVWPYESKFETAVNDPNNAKYILAVVDAALIPAEKVRNTALQTPKPVKG